MIHAAIALILQEEWQYMQQVVPNSAPLLAPLERPLQNNLLLALLGVNWGDVEVKLR